MIYLITLLVIWLIMALIIGNYANSIFKGERPFGLGGALLHVVHRVAITPRWRG